MVIGSGGGDCKGGDGGMMMELLERLNYAEMKLDEARQRRDDIDKEYWLGYIDGLRAAMRKDGGDAVR